LIRLAADKFACLESVARQANTLEGPITEAFMLPIPPSPRPANTTQETTTAQPQAFEEVRLNDKQLEDKLAKLRRKGYFTIPMSPATKALLHAESQSGPRWKSSDFGMINDLGGLPQADVLNDAATRIFSHITDDPAARLRPNGVEIRNPAPQVAEQWHQDLGPKVLTCIATLKGKGTEFVSLEASRNEFKEVEQPKHWIPIPPEDRNPPTETLIREAKKEKFYFFAALALKDESIPKLLHRAPSEPDRSIFLARWSDGKRR
jgi:hypothetical protein